MSVFNSLPDEVIESILLVKTVSCKELCCFAQCSKRFYNLSKDDKLWKQKANERWRFWHRSFQKRLDWQTVYQKRHQVEAFLKKQLCLLEEECDLQSPISKKDFGFVRTCLDKFGEDSYFYLNDAFQTVLNGTDSSKNLTQKYFTKNGNVVLTHIMCKEELQMYLETPERTEHLEEGATIIARWMCPLTDILIEDIYKSIEDIVDMVRARLGEQEQNITSKSDKTIQLKALKTVQEVFYEQLKFSGNKENYYSLSNSYINEVLETKCGIPITLSILFQSIAKRIGLCIEPVNCPGHFLVRWKYFDASVNEIKYHHIDCFNQGVFLDQTHLPHKLSPSPAPSPREVLKRMMLNIINILQSEVETSHLQESIVSLSHALDLFMILAPNHLEMTRLNARIKLYLRIQLDEVIQSLQELLYKQSVPHFEDKRLLEVAKQQEQSLKKKNKPLKLKLRSDPKNSEVALNVGTIMHHRRFDYRCVVYGWDRVCKMPEEWIAQMGVDNLSNGRNQPFYNVLVSDGTERYASQESLGPEPQIKMITHPNVGLFFKEFTGNCYIPNNQLQKLYPEDFP